MIIRCTKLTDDWRPTLASCLLFFSIRCKVRIYLCLYCFFFTDWWDPIWSDFDELRIRRNEIQSEFIYTRESFVGGAWKEKCCFESSITNALGRQAGLVKISNSHQFLRIFLTKFFPQSFTPLALDYFFMHSSNEHFLLREYEKTYDISIIYIYRAPKTFFLHAHAIEWKQCGGIFRFFFVLYRSVSTVDYLYGYWSLRGSESNEGIRLEQSLLGCLDIFFSFWKL